MSVALLILAAAAPDAAFDAYARCADTAAAAHIGSNAAMDDVIARIEKDCASDRAAVLDGAADRDQAAQRLQMMTTVAIAGRLNGEPAPPRASEAPPAAAASRYPKLDAYRLCIDDHAAKIEAELPYATAAAITTEAVASCEKTLKEAAGELVAEMRQPALRQQVTSDFRRRATADLTQKINARRAPRK